MNGIAIFKRQVGSSNSVKWFDLIVKLCSLNRCWWKRKKKTFRRHGQKGAEKEKVIGRKKIQKRKKRKCRENLERRRCQERNKKRR